MTDSLATRCATALVVALAFTSPASASAPDVQEVIASPGTVWQRFLAEAEYPAVYGAYGTLIDAGYSLEGVDAGACAAAAASLDEAVQLAPVSIAVHRMRLQCAEALDDEAGAEEALEAVAALSNLALQDGREPFSPKPIRVLAPMDIYALLASSGLEYRYEYYALPRARRHFPLVVAAWDEVLKVERHLMFDYIDVVSALSRGDTYSGFPYQRQLLVESFLTSHAEAGDVAAGDWQATRAAAAEGDVRAKPALLSTGAEAGGLQSLAAWIALCAVRPFEGCDDGLVDALLPHAEKRQAAHVTLLALAYALGVGVERDEAKAAAFLDSANRRWYGDGALVLFSQSWVALGRKPPAFLARRLAAAARAGSTGALAASAWLKLAADGVPQLEPAEVRALSSPATNGVGHGYALLANYHVQRDEARVADAWMKFAADAGNPDAQAAVGVHAHRAASHPAQRADALRMVELGAQGGSALGMRYLGYQSARSEAWADAEGWLIAAAVAGDPDALLQLAELYEWERPGLRGTQQQAVGIYRSMAAHAEFPAARRRLADMALAGRGIDRDPDQAERWLRQDAEAGDALSAGRLAMAYFQGEFGEADEQKGGEWMRRAVDAGEKDAYADWGAWYFYRNGNSLASRQRGIALWSEGADADSRGALNNLAWAYCTAPESELFDPARGLEHVGTIMQWDDIEPGVLDTVAACHAAAGDFARAIELQQRVIDMLTPQEQEADRKREDNFFSRLALYGANERYVEAHREQWPEH